MRDEVGIVIILVMLFYMRKDVDYLKNQVRDLYNRVDHLYNTLLEKISKD